MYATTDNITVNFVNLHDIYNVEQIIVWLRHLIDIFPKESQLYTGEIRNIKLINTVDFTDALLHNFNKYYELYTSWANHQKVIMEDTKRHNHNQVKFHAISVPFQSVFARS
jgi:hypothetical protein